MSEKAVLHLSPGGEPRWYEAVYEPHYNEAGQVIGVLSYTRDFTERKKAEEALQEREEQYRAFFENSIDAVLLTSPDGTIHAANPAACKIFAMSEEEITRVGRNGIVDVSDPRLKSGLEERARTGKFRGELNYRRKDGTLFPGEVSSAFFKDKNGFVKTVMIIRDITERKQIEEALRKSEEHYRMLFTNMNEAFFLGEIIYDIHGKPHDYRFLELNPAFELHTGIKEEDVLGRSHLEVFHKVDPIVLEKYREVALSGKPTHFEFFTQLTNMYLDIYVFSPEQGKFAAILRDITERKQMEEKTRQRAEEIEAVMEVAPVAIWIGHDPKCHNITGNRMANELYEAQLGENVSADVPVRRFFREGHELTVDELPMQKAAFKDIDVRNEEIDVLLPSGEWKSFLGSASPLHDSDGHVRGSVAASIDITQRRKAEAKLKETLDNLEELVKERTAELEKAYISLKESEASLAEAQKMAHIGNWDWDLVTNKLSASDEMCRIFGLNSQEFDASYEAFLNYVHPADRDCINTAYKDVLNGKKLVGNDYRIVLAEGEERVVHVQGEVIFNEGNIPVRMRGTAQDITERKKTEKALELSEERYRIAAEQTGQLIYDYNVEKGTTDWAGDIKEITGYSPEKSKNLNLDILLSRIHPEDRKMFLKKYERFLICGGIYRTEYRFRKENGEYIYIEDNGVCLKDEKGKVKRIIGVIKNITERKKVEETIANIETARKREIHHRIKNNLQVISSLLDLQAEKFKSRKQVEDSEILSAFRESQDRIISIALIHEELHEGKGTNELNFSPYLEKLVENLFQTYKLGNIDLSLNMDLEENIFFDIDIAVPLGLIVNEVVSNSLKYAFSGRTEGIIQIKLCREKNAESLNNTSGSKTEDYKNKVTNFILTVSDNGVGIPESINLENSDTLGLQLIIILVDQLEGKLELKRDSGTEFTIKFAVSEKE
jgi:PAS domain S-box-containing protein